MIDLRRGPDGLLRVAIDPVLEGHRERRRDAAFRLLRAISGRLPAGSFATEIERLADLPHAHGLVAHGAGHVDATRAELLVSSLMRMPGPVVERVREGRISMLQDESLLPTAETRSARVMLAPGVAECGPDFLDESIARIADAAGTGWRQFVSIIRTVTMVAVEGRPDLPYFSGCSSDFWGSIHLSPPRSEAVLAEGLTHEAAHLWLMLAEDSQPLCQHAWDGPSWHSPWRDDPRPLGGIVHGVFVFSCASLVLSCLSMRWTDVAERIARITAQVEEGVAECQRSGMLSALGTRVVESSLSRIAVARTGVPSDVVESARDVVRRQQESKRNRRNAIVDPVRRA